MTSQLTNNIPYVVERSEKTFTQYNNATVEHILIQAESWQSDQSLDPHHLDLRLEQMSRSEQMSKSDLIVSALEAAGVEEKM